jgi:hypothetical protein
VLHGPAWDPLRYSCAPVSDSRGWNHTVIRCTVGPGVSHSHRFTVKTRWMDARLSVPGLDAFSFPAPEVFPNTLRRFSPSGEPLDNLTAGAPFAVVNSTVASGGEVVGFDGRFFGPVAADITVEYGRPFLHYRYRAEIIPEFTNQTHIRVRTAPGRGLRHFMSVLVGDQSATGVDIFSYPLAAPAARNTTCAAASRVAFAPLATAGAPTRFLVVARDWAGRDTARGGDLWELSIADRDDNSPVVRPRSRPLL